MRGYNPFIYLVKSVNGTKVIDFKHFVKLLDENKEKLSAYFKYPKNIRRIIYTTNIIEFVHKQFRKLTKTKGAFPNENTLLKLLYMGIQNASKKWTMLMRNWSLTISQFAIFFEGSLEEKLDL